MYARYSTVVKLALLLPFFFLYLLVSITLGDSIISPEGAALVITPYLLFFGVYGISVLVGILGFLREKSVILRILIIVVFLFTTVWPALQVLYYHLSMPIWLTLEELKKVNYNWLELSIWVGIVIALIDLVLVCPPRYRKWTILGIISFCTAYAVLFVTSPKWLGDQQVLNAIRAERIVEVKRQLTPALIQEHKNSPELARVLYEASIEDDRELIRRLLDNGVDINTLSFVTTGDTPLIAAIEAANIDLLRFLLERGADPNKGHVGSSYTKGPGGYGFTYRPTHRGPIMSPLKFLEFKAIAYTANDRVGWQWVSITDPHLMQKMNELLTSYGGTVIYVEEEELD